MMSTERSLCMKYLYIMFVVSLYWIISILMVFLNKTLLSSEKIHLDAPFFITWFQCLTSIAIIFVIDRIENMSIFSPKYNLLSSDSHTADKNLTKKMLLLAVIFTAMIASNNLCLKYVGVTFYFIGRSLTTVFNVIFTYIILGEHLSPATVTCCGIVITGFILGIDQENVSGSLSLLGLLFGVFASLTVSLYSIGTKKILPHLNQNVWRLSFYNNVYSSLLLLPLMLLNGEFEALYNYDKLWHYDFWITMILAGLCGFAIGFITTLQIKVTSALTHNISGTAKACAQTVLATYYYDDPKSPLWWFSNILVLCGSAAYARVKQVEMKQRFVSQHNPKIIS